ncbi:MAG: sensor histidine kinase [Dehalococcoidia bacterium]
MKDRLRPLTSIRTRIALSIFGAAVVSLVIMSVTVFVAFRAALLDNLDDSLSASAVSNMNLVERTSEPLRLLLADDQLIDIEDKEVVRLYDTTGRLIDDSDTAPKDQRSLGAERELVMLALQGENPIRSVKVNGTTFREKAVPVRRGGEVVGVLITGIKPASVAESLDLLALTLLIAVPVTGGVLAIAAFVIARNALRPVQEITATARRIARGDLHQRLRPAETQDEVGELALTFNLMIERLEENFARERRFTGDVSHQLRTPLTAIETALEVTLSKDRTAEEYRDVLRIMAGRTAGLSRLTRHLLLLSRLDAQAEPASFKPVSVLQLLDSVIDDFQQDHARSKVSLIASESDAMIAADAELLSQAFANVLENAWTHAGADATVTVDWSVRGDHVLVSFADDGPGVAPDVLPSIFQRFRRDTRTKRSEGAGLGLAIADSIARLHRGSVSATSGSPGLEVSFRLPVSGTAT